MQNYFIVALGAALGGAFRYWMTGAVQKIFPSTFPYGTLSVNILGSFLLGIIIFFFDYRELIPPEIKLFLTIGFCGGFTTFSTFSFETINLLRDSEYLYAIMNISANLFLTMFAVILAYYLSKIVIGD
jgi:CrcB protein